MLWTALYLVWVILFRGQTLTFTRTLTVQFCYLVFIAANYYFQVFVAIPRWLYRKKYTAFALALPAGIALTALLRAPLAAWLQQHYFRPGFPPEHFGRIAADSFLNIFVWVICLVAGRLVFEKIRFRQLIDAMEKEKVRQELDFLKAQFNPHFLFNSINSIYGHIDRKNEKARHMLLSFSEMLRYQLYECNVDAVGIDKEVRYIRNYIALQQVRMQEDLEVCLDIPDNITGFTIAPLLFISFIENAFKYVSRRENGNNRVEVSLHWNGDRLIFRTFNTRDRFTSGHDLDHSGIGLANIRRRLDLQYPDKYEWWTNDQDDYHEVVLQLQLDPGRNESAGRLKEQPAGKN